MKKILSLFLLGVFLLSACAAPTPAATNTSVPSLVPTIPPATPTAEPPRVLKLCLGQEPQSLYPFTSQSRAARTILQFLNDGPFDQTMAGEQAVLFSELPTLENGGIKVQPVDVSSGFAVQTVTGEAAILKQGVKVFPSGCKDASCSLEWDGVSPLQMDQVQIQYKIKPEAKWSDGTALTAKDSVFSYQIATQQAARGSRGMVLFTAEYQAADETTVVWKGIPGAVPQRLADAFWYPLPEHALNSIAATDLPQAEAAAVQPLSWGAFRIEKWEKGTLLSLVKNPSYFRAAENLPYFDRVEIRFIDQAGKTDLAGLLMNGCDVIDGSTIVDSQLQQVPDLVASGRVQQQVVWGPEMNGISLGIKPAGYDDSYNIGLGDRADFFGKTEVRMAIAQCIDRQALAKSFPLLSPQIPLTFQQPGLEAATTDLQPVAFNQQQAKAALEEAGWKDSDNDPKTPRIAVGVAGVADGTPLTIKLFTSENSVRKEIGAKVAASLNACGIQVELVSQPAEQLFAPGPEGVLFGRNFDLAEWAFAPQCSSFGSWQVPGAANGWVGMNVAGYQSAEYDQLCQTLQANGVLDKSKATEQWKNLHQVLWRDLPYLPLYFQPHVSLAKSELCGFMPDAAADTAFSNAESLSFQKDCPKP